MADLGVGSWPHRRARIDPHGIALRQGDRSRSYGELADRVERLATALAGLGVRAGDRVGYLGNNDIVTFECLFAVLRLGAIFAPFNTRLSPPEIGYLLDDAGPRVLVVGAEHAELASDAGPAAHGVRHVIATDGDGPGTVEGLAETGRGGRPASATVGLADDAVILYTSGTTGRPKGAVLTHANITFNTMNQLAHVDVLGSDTALCIAPLFHAAALGQVSLPTLFKGGTVVVAGAFDPAVVLRLIESERIASFSAVPTILQLLCDHERFERTDLSSLRYAIYGGSSVLERVAIEWQRRGVAVLQGYGMTEASPGVYLAIPDGAAQRPMSVGVPHFFTDVTLSPGAPDVGPGRSGELLVGGLNVFRGYWNRPDATEAAFESGWYRSGDVVRVADDGWAYIVDRVRDVIISGGENVYPAEVEAVIGDLPGIVDVAVVATSDEQWGEVGVAHVVVTDPDDWTAEGLRAALSGRLAKFKIPKYVRFAATLPKTATGKVRKQDLRALPVPDEESRP